MGFSLESITLEERQELSATFFRDVGAIEGVGAQQLAMAADVRSRLLRDRDDGHRCFAL